MKIYFDNVDFGSSSGPNNFALKLRRELKKLGHPVVSSPDKADVALAFVRSSQNKIPYVLRLDGIFFNPKTDYKTSNQSIIKAYRGASAVILQSEYTKKVITNFFGNHKSQHVIHNGTDLEKIESIPAREKTCQGDVWSCAASWRDRPHKRLHDNIRYFSENRGKHDTMLVCGVGSNDLGREGVRAVGNLEWEDMIALFKSCKYFLHLGYVDNCPNVVIDARACGCQIICSSLGGTPEIAGKDGIIIEDFDWDMKTPFDYTKVPKLDFSKRKNGSADIDIDIKSVAKKYVKVMEGVL